MFRPENRHFVLFSAVGYSARTKNPKLGWFRPENRHFVLFSAVGYSAKKSLAL
jgi:hypothetical protein